MYVDIYLGFREDLKYLLEMLKVLLLNVREDNNVVDIGFNKVTPVFKLTVHKSLGKGW